MNGYSKDSERTKRRRIKAHVDEHLRNIQVAHGHAVEDVDELEIETLDTSECVTEAVAEGGLIEDHDPDNCGLAQDDHAHIDNNDASLVEYVETDDLADFQATQDLIMEDDGINFAYMDDFTVPEEDAEARPHTLLYLVLKLCHKLTQTSTF